MAERVRAILIGSSGNLVEWYDFYVYSAFSLYFAKAFFPAGDQTAQLLNTAAIFAVGFLMRPIGAWLFGRMADRHGRRVALTTSVLLMCFGSGLVAVTPVYATIGIAAPVILLLARMIQGLSLGGEYGTSATYLSEMATADHRGFYSSFQYVTLIGGQLTAILVLIALQKVVLTPEELDAWGWRIPFAIGALLSAVAFWMRRDLLETEAFQRATRREGSLAALAAHPREVAIVVGLTLGGTLAFYTYTTYMQKFLVNTSGFPKDIATLISASTLFIYMLLQPVVGSISDAVGRRPVLIAFGVLGTLSTVPIMSALQVGARPLAGFRIDTHGIGDRVGLHGDQCRGEGRTLSDFGPGSRRRASVRADRCRLRRHRRIRGAMAEAGGTRNGFLLVRFGLHRRFSCRLRDDARYARQKRNQVSRR